MPNGFEDISDRVFGGATYRSLGITRENAVQGTVRALNEEKALICLEIAERILPHISDFEAEGVAADFMYIPVDKLAEILKKLKVKDSVQDTGEKKEIKRENRYSILKRENGA
jgi:hypothetical protein